jgi:two-component system chemotaxis sensor kinase CheA
MTDQDIIREFLVESAENLDQLDRDLVVLEKAPDDRRTLASVFRTIHTIKGTCGFFGFAKLEAVAHAGETLLSRLRDGLLRLTPEIATALLKMIDAVRAMLARIETDGAEGDGDYAALVARLTELQVNPGTAGVPPAHVHVAGDPPSVAAAVAGGTPAVPGKPPDASAADASIRVDVGVLDQLLNLVGELVLAKNHVAAFAADGPDPAARRAVQRLAHVTRDLQGQVLKTRMQPLATVWDRFPRVVRDLAAHLGKTVRLECDGGDTELDRGILEAIKDPLTHVVRNAVDHGIEKPDVRAARGKPAEGTVRLRAFQEGGQVVLEIRDDGGGISPARVKAKAVEKGLISTDRAARMTDHDATMLIFAPGFSTAEQVTTVSGRGVGMDVVKTNVERVGGSLDVQSTVGVGTTLRLRIPLTLAIVPALVVTGDGDRFAIPQVSLLEILRLDAAAGRGESLHGVPVFRHRDRLLPLVDLRTVLALNDTPPPADRNVVVLEAERRRFGLVVDSVLDAQEIVVKPLDEQLKALAVYGGATILGDGGVVLILDALGLAARAGVPVSSDEPTTEPVEEPADVQTLLVLGVGERRRVAVPMRHVVRLEEVPAAGVECAGGFPVMQHRGDIIPVVWVTDVLGEPPRPWPTGPVCVVIYRDGGRTVGLAADRVIDVVEAAVELHATAARPGVAGTAVLQGRVTELLDLPTALRLADPWAHLAAGAV